MLIWIQKGTDIFFFKPTEDTYKLLKVSWLLFNEEQY